MIFDFIDVHLDEYDDFPVDTKKVSLRHGLKSYYETAGFLTQAAFYPYLGQTPNGIVLTGMKSSVFLLKYTTSISLIHLYFEHSIHEMLETIRPALSRVPAKLFSMASLMDGSFDATTAAEKNRISYSIALNRLIALIDHHQNLPAAYKVPEEYHFIKHYVPVLKKCAKLRNEIIHHGELVLKRYPYELLFVNHIIPLIHRTLSISKRDVYLDRNTACGINVLAELTKCQLTEDYKNPKNFHITQTMLKRINHLKELGRASFLNELGMHEDESLNRENIEHYHNRQIRIFNQRLAEGRSAIFESSRISQCPCCGIRSLVSSKQLHTGEKQAVCVQCTYTVYAYLGEPAEFNIMDVEVLI